MPVRQPMHRLPIVLALLVLLLVGAVAPSAAEAGAYEVLFGCTANGEANHSWVYETNDPNEFETATSCPTSSTTSTPLWGMPNSGAFTGVYARTELGGATGPSTGEYAQLTLRVPLGNTLTRLSLRRWLGKEGGSGWTLYGRTADGVTLPGETCEVPSGADSCEVGGPPRVGVDLTLSTTAVSYGQICSGFGSCADGSTIHSARVAIYSSSATVSDPTSPTITSTSGALLDESSTHQGTETATVVARDSSGIKELRAYVDGEVRGRKTRPCDYSRMQPCPDDDAAISVSLDTRGVLNGEHTLRMGAVDTAGNVTLGSPRRFVVANPIPPVLIPPAAPAEPVTPTTETPTNTESPSVAETPVFPLAAPTPPTPVVGRAADPPPRSATRLTITDARRTRVGLSARGRVTAVPDAPLVVRYRSRVGRRAYRSTQRVAARSGRWSATVRLPRRALRAKGTVEISFAGDGQYLPARTSRRVATLRARASAAIAQGGMSSPVATPLRVLHSRPSRHPGPMGARGSSAGR